MDQGLQKRAFPEEGMSLGEKTSGHSSLFSKLAASHLHSLDNSLKQGSTKERMRAKIMTERKRMGREKEREQEN